MNRVGALIHEDEDAISLLRAVMPPRALNWAEVHSVAERQATLLLELNHITEPPVPQFVISSLPGVVVDWRDNWPTSGMSVRAESHWRIVVRGNERRVRQRFTLAHEFKHVLDDPLIERLLELIPEDQRHARAERLCNYFAACLLMPRAWVKHDWGEGTQNVRSLARRYYVSTEAMSTRLSELGLTMTTLALEPKTRHRSAA